MSCHVVDHYFEGAEGQPQIKFGFNGLVWCDTCLYFAPKTKYRRLIVLLPLAGVPGWYQNVLILAHDQRPSGHTPVRSGL